MGRRKRRRRRKKLLLRVPLVAIGAKKLLRFLLHIHFSLTITAEKPFYETKQGYFELT